MTSIDDTSDAGPEDGGAEDARHAGPDVNVGVFERGASVTMGTALLALALSQRRKPGAFAFGLAGAYLAWRGATGHCALYEALDTGTAEDPDDERLDAGGHDDVSIEAAATIARPPDEVYAFFRRLENAPRFMAFIESVQETGATRSRWVARAPTGQTLDWEAEILEDIPGQLIAWRSDPRALVHHAGAVRFRPAPGGRGTEVRLGVEYDPPGSAIGRSIAALFGSATEYRVDEDLRRLKQILEAGETATTRGQPQASPESAAGA
jgi:uncharacterized membrane protein